MTLSIQFITMLVMVGSGIYLGIVLDTFRRLLQYIRKKQTLIFILEVIFWIVQAIILFYILFRVNAGELRLYILLACLLGLSLYQALLKKTYLSILEYFLRLFRSICRIVFRIIELLLINPVKWLLFIVLGIGLFFIRILSPVLLLILKVLFIPIRFTGKLIVPIVPKKLLGYFHKNAGIYSTIIENVKKFRKWFDKKGR